MVDKIYLVLARIFVKPPRPRNSEETFTVFESACPRTQHRTNRLVLH